MDVIKDFNPLDVLAAAAAWQSANQDSVNDLESEPSILANPEINQLTTDDDNTDKPVNQPIVHWKAPPFPDHAYALVPRDVTVTGDDVIDDVDSTVRHSPTSHSAVTESEEQETDGQLFIVLDEDADKCSTLNENYQKCDNDVEHNASASENGIVDDVVTDDVTDGFGTSSAPLSGGNQPEANNNDRKLGPESKLNSIVELDFDKKFDCDAALRSDIKADPDLKSPAAAGSDNLDLVGNVGKLGLAVKVDPDVNHCEPTECKVTTLLKDTVSERVTPSLDTKPELKIDVERLVSTSLDNSSISLDTSIPGDIIPYVDMTSGSGMTSQTAVIKGLTTEVTGRLVTDQGQVICKLQKPGVLMVRTNEPLLSDKLVSPPTGRSHALVSPPSHHPSHACVSLDCCSPSDISTCVSRDLCVDRLSSASSQDLYTDDLDSPRTGRFVVSPPRERKRRQSRGLYHIPLGPLLHDAEERPEHPLKDHDYCLHSFYLAITHNRQDEPLRKPGPSPKCKDPLKMRKKYEKKNKKKRRSSELVDLGSYKEDIFSDSDSVNLDSPCKSGKSSPTNSLTSSLDLSRDRTRLRDKRVNSLPSFLEKPKDRPTSNFNDNFFFFGRRPKRRNRTVVENNHDKLKKFNRSEFLPGLDISYLEARAKFHKKVDSAAPEVKTEILDSELTGNEPSPHATQNGHNPDLTQNVLNTELSIPKGGLAFGISEEESNFIDSLHCETIETPSFHSADEITHEQVKELLTVVGVDNAMKLIEGTGLNDNGLTSHLNENSTSSSGLDLPNDTTTSNDKVTLNEDHATGCCEGLSAELTADHKADDAVPDTMDFSKNVDSLDLNLPASSAPPVINSNTDSVDTTVMTSNAARPNSLPISPHGPSSTGNVDLIKDSGHDNVPSQTENTMPNLGQDLGEHLPATDLHETSLLGATTPELHLGHVSDLGATTPELPFGGTTPHDLLDLDDTDLLNANLNLNMNSLLNFQSPEKVYHPNGTSRPVLAGPTQRKLDLDAPVDASLQQDSQTTEKPRSYIRNYHQTLGKPDQLLKSQMFKNLSELDNASSEDHGVPELITVNMFWNDLPGLLINGTQYVRLVDIHKQVLPAKPTGLLKNRCKALNMEIRECTELQRDFLIRYAHAAASRSQIIVSKQVAETLIGYYVDNRPGRKMEESTNTVDCDQGTRHSHDFSKQRKAARKDYYKNYIDVKPRGRPRGTCGSSNVNVTFKIGPDVFHKRVQTCGFSLLDSGDTSDDGDTDPQDRVTSQAQRFQKILHLRNQIKSIRSEIYAIQKRQQRADARKSKGLAKRQRQKPSKKVVISYEPKRLVKAPLTCVSKTHVRTLPTVRVAPNMDNTRSVSPTPKSISPKPTTPGVIVQPLTPPATVPSAIVTPLSAVVTPLTSRTDNDVDSVLPDVNSDLSFTDMTKSDLNDKSPSVYDNVDETKAILQKDVVCDDTVMTSGADTSLTGVPSFRCSTPSDQSKGASRLGVQHYTSGQDCQNGYLYLNMFVSSKSSCIRCATCFQLMTVTEFVNHLHSSDDHATLIKNNLIKPRHLIVQDQHLLSAHQASLWQQFQNKTSASLSPVRPVKKDCSSKRKLNVQLARVGRARTTTLCEEKVEAPEPLTAKKPSHRRSVPAAVKPESESSRYSGRVRKRKQYSPDEGYSLPRVANGKMMKRSRSESILSKRTPVVKVTPLATNSFGRPVCKVSPRPVAKISPSIHSPSYKSPDRQRSRAEHR